MENWLDGAWRPSADGATFTRSRDGRPGSALRWPRSTAADWRAAVESARRAAPAWHGRSRAERAALVAAALARLRAAPDPTGDLGAKLALSGDDLARHARRARPCFVDDAPRPTAALVRADARALFAGLAEFAAELVAGRCVVGLADPRLPEIAHAFAAQLAASDLPRGVFALLHEDRDTVRRAAFADPELDDVVLAGDHEQLAVWAREARALDRRAVRGPFGAGVVAPLASAQRARWRTRPIRASVHCVLLADDPRLSARRVVESACGGTRTLGAVLDRQVGRVVCHQRRFAAFCAALLEELAALGELALARGVWAELDPERERRLAAARRLAQDEGATLLAVPAGGSPSAGRGATMAVSPIDELLLATNVAERMRFARPGPPGPILGLLRAPSDVEARALARRLAPVPGLDLDRRGARAADWSAGRERSMGGIAPGLQEGASR